MARPREFDENEVLDKAVKVFWELGYEATSIGDLVEHMGINRASLYGAFGSKAQLFIAVLDRYADQVVSQLVYHLRKKPSAKASIHDFFKVLVEHGAKGGVLRGCLVTNSAVDGAMANPEIAAKVTTLLKSIENCFYAVLERGLSAGEFDAGMDIQAQARYLTSSMQGMLVMSKVFPEAKVLQDVADHILNSLER